MAGQVSGRLGAAGAYMGRTFAWWVLGMATVSYLLPAPFVPLASIIPYLLGAVMFGMGLTLAPKDFSAVLRHPLEVLAGVLGQYLLMPLIAFCLCHALALPAEIAVGVILVGCCPGGTASNVMTYLARGDVALSVTITALTTALAPLVTPALVYLLASQWVAVDPLGMFLSITKVVFVPLGLGVAIHTLWPDWVGKVEGGLPLISGGAVIAIVCAVVAASHSKIASAGMVIFLVVALHNLMGYLCGWLLGRALGMEPPRCRAMTFEVGMQNSGLGVALAMAHFSPLAAVPAAIFSVFHNLSGGVMAGFFRRAAHRN
ncbi:MAG: bile acid:sodium symporter family protein [Succinivibrionaceae bacterium]|nr:bile acid:sodium symporter family protein [Succinivibrionaceae bacterium]